MAQLVEGARRDSSTRPRRRSYNGGSKLSEIKAASSSEKGNEQMRDEQSQSLEDHELSQIIQDAVSLVGGNERSSPRKPRRQPSRDSSSCLVNEPAKVELGDSSVRSERSSPRKPRRRNSRDGADDPAKPDGDNSFRSERSSPRKPRRRNSRDGAAPYLADGPGKVDMGDESMQSSQRSTRRAGRRSSKDGAASCLVNEQFSTELGDDSMMSERSTRRASRRNSKDESASCLMSDNSISESSLSSSRHSRSRSTHDRSISNLDNSLGGSLHSRSRSSHNRSISNLDGVFSPAEPQSSLLGSYKVAEPEEGNNSIVAMLLDDKSDFSARSTRQRNMIKRSSSCDGGDVRRGGSCNNLVDMVGTERRRSRSKLLSPPGKGKDEVVVSRHSSADASLLGSYDDSERPTEKDIDAQGSDQTPRSIRRRKSTDLYSPRNDIRRGMSCNNLSASARMESERRLSRTRSSSKIRDGKENTAVLKSPSAQSSLLGRLEDSERPVEKTGIDAMLCDDRSEVSSRGVRRRKSSDLLSPGISKDSVRSMRRARSSYDLSESPRGDNSERPAGRTRTRSRSRSRRSSAGEGKGNDSQPSLLGSSGEKGMENMSERSSRSARGESTNLNSPIGEDSVRSIRRGRSSNNLSDNIRSERERRGSIRSRSRSKTRDIVSRASDNKPSLLGSMDSYERTCENTADSALLLDDKSELSTQSNRSRKGINRSSSTDGKDEGAARRSISIDGSERSSTRRRRRSRSRSRSVSKTRGDVGSRVSDAAAQPSLLGSLEIAPITPIGINSLLMDDSSEISTQNSRSRTKSTDDGEDDSKNRRSSESENRKSRSSRRSSGNNVIESPCSNGEKIVARLRNVDLQNSASPTTTSPKGNSAKSRFDASFDSDNNKSIFETNEPQRIENIAKNLSGNSSTSCEKPTSVEEKSLLQKEVENKTEDNSSGKEIGSLDEQSQENEVEKKKNVAVASSPDENSQTPSKEKKPTDDEEETVVVTSPPHADGGGDPFGAMEAFFSAVGTKLEEPKYKKEGFADNGKRFFVGLDKYY